MSSSRWACVALVVLLVAIAWALQDVVTISLTTQELLEQLRHDAHAYAVLTRPAKEP